MPYEFAPLKNYRIVTDAVSVDIQAMDEDEAAQKFARRDPVYAGAQCVADLIWRAKELGGSIVVTEI